MSIDYPTYKETINRIRADVLNDLPEVDATIFGSFIRAFVDGLGGRSFDHTVLLQQLEKQVFPQTSTDEYLERWAAYEDLERFTAELANGEDNISVTGTPGTELLAGKTLVTENGNTYITKTNVTVSANTINIISLTRSGNIVTAIVAVNHNLATTNQVTINNYLMWLSRVSAADNDWTSVAYGNGIFVAVADSGTSNRVMTSTDGITWTIRTSAADNDWKSVTYGNGIFVAVSNSGTSNRVMTSPDGITWTIRTSAADNSWRSVTYGNGLFVAIAATGTGNRVMTSPDGITWTIRTSAADNNWRSVTYGNGLFVAVGVDGSGNRVMTSPDGITWTIRVSAADNNWQSVTYGNGLFVAVASSGTYRVMTSPDGITWTLQSSPVANDWESVTYGNGLFVAVSVTGAGDRVMTSPDGIAWISGASAADVRWFGITYANSIFVAVGRDGVGNRVMTAYEVELGYNGTFPVSVVSELIFEYNISAFPASPMTGNITATYDNVVGTVESVETGLDKNVDPGGRLTLSTPLSGIDNDLYVTFAGITGGLDVETDERLLVRILSSRANPVANFNVGAITKKAFSVTGVTRILVKRITPSIGYVTILFVRDDDDTIIPNAAEIAEVKAAIVTILPAQSSEDNVIVSAPVAITTDYIFTAISPDSTEMQTAIRTNLQAFYEDSVLFETTISSDSYRSAIIETVNPDTGEKLQSFNLTTPAGDIIVTTGEIGVLGSVSF